MDIVINSSRSSSDVLSLFPHLSKKYMTMELSHVDDFVGKVKLDRTC